MKKNTKQIKGKKIDSGGKESANQQLPKDTKKKVNSRDPEHEIDTDFHHPHPFKKP